MGHESGLEYEVRDVIKRNRWLILSTASPKRVPQSSLVVYASDGYKIYILTGKDTYKIKNIVTNPSVSVTIPFYKNLLHRMIVLAPPAAVSFKAKAEIIDFGDKAAAEFYQRVLRYKLPDEFAETGVWLRLTPVNIATCHGLGVSLLEFRDLEKAYKVIKLTDR
jgi:hypothetical protein